VRLDAIGEPQADSAPARVTPPLAARNWRRDIPVIGAYFCSCPGVTRAAVMWGTQRNFVTGFTSMQASGAERRRSVASM
jgi:hypothetical protein